MVDNGEIEYFEFVPTDFLNDLQASVEETIVKFIDKEFSFTKSVKRKDIKKLLLDSAKKNLFIFRNFVLKNIVSFPPKFNLERKRVDYIEERELNLILKEYCISLEKLVGVRNEIRRERENKAVAEYERHQFETLLLGNSELKEMALCLMNLKDKHKRVQDYIKKIPFYNLSDENFNSLLEHRELRSEMLKKELKEMEEAIDVDYLHSLV